MSSLANGCAKKIKEGSTPSPANGMMGFMMKEGSTPSFANGNKKVVNEGATPSLANGIKKMLNDGSTAVLGADLAPKQAAERLTGDARTGDRFFIILAPLAFRF